MANVRQSNVVYVDTAQNLFLPAPTKMVAVLMTSTSANAILQLEDNTLGVTMQFRIATAGESKLFEFDGDKQVLFQNGIEATTVTNCNASIIYRRA